MNRVGLLALSVICLAKNSLGKAPTNLALKKPSSQRSIFNLRGLSFSPSLANDGDLATRAFTQSARRVFWFVDLEDQFHVTYILLKLEKPWDNLHVGVGDNPPIRKSVPGQDFKVCKNFTEFPGDWIQEIPCNITGRYVIVYSIYRMNLVIVEVEVYNTTEPGRLGIGRLDLARGKKTGQQSRYDGSHYGNDGDPSTETNAIVSEPPAVWHVDLEGRFQVTSIVLYCLENWTDLTVDVAEEPPTRISKLGVGVKVFTGRPKDTSQNITCEKAGRYVVIFSKATTVINIKEVEVYGIKIEPVATIEPSTTIEPVTTIGPITSIEPLITIEPNSTFEPLTTTEPNSTLDPTTAKPDEQKPIDWLYWLFTVIFFALLPVLGTGACYFIKRIRADRAKERRLSALRDTSMEEDTDVISNKNLKEERDTEALKKTVNPIAPGASKSGVKKSRKRIATLSQKKKPGIVQKSTPKAISSAKKLPNTSVAKVPSVKSTPKTKRSLASNKQLAKSKSVLTGRSNKTITKSFVSLASTPQTKSKKTKGLRNKSTKDRSK